jgi:hypothetical protein
MQPGIGFPPDSQVDLLRKLVWNTWYLAGGSGGSGIPAWVPAPASSGASGVAGQMAYDDEYFYVCIASGVWRRTPINDW